VEVGDVLNLVGQRGELVEVGGEQTERLDLFRDVSVRTSAVAVSLRVDLKQIKINNNNRTNNNNNKLILK
jgi:hypothetical protein